MPFVELPKQCTPTTNDDWENRYSVRYDYGPMNSVETLEYDGVTLEIPDRLIGEEVRAAFDQGWYERQEAELIRECLPPSVDVIELGAGIGYVSCVAIR